MIADKTAHIACQLARATLLALLIGALLAARAQSASAGGSCPNEQLRHESLVNPVTGAPYSVSLPDCRAYEMVSPLYKQSRDAEIAPSTGIPVAPDGEAVGYHSQGAFAGAENELQGAQNENLYVARRGAQGWTTSSAYPPVALLPGPTTKGLASDFSADLHSAQANCGTAVLGTAGDLPPRILCVTRTEGGPWIQSPFYSTPEEALEVSAEYAGAATDFSRLFMQPAVPLLPQDTTLSGSIYELTGVGGEEPQLKIVNVTCPGVCTAEEEASTELAVYTQHRREAPYLGDRRRWAGEGANKVAGTSVHAISESGTVVYLTATPASSLNANGTGIKTIYARVGNGTPAAHTVAASAPSSECTGECAAAPPANATYQGASADGAKVFFTTAQPLLNQDMNVEPELTQLYEYDLETGKLALLSGGKPGQEVRGVVRTSTDGSHVYFVASGPVLTSEKNGNGEEAREGQSNLYAYDTDSDELKFVASTGEDTGGLKESADEGPGEEGPRERHAQTTPDGRYLVFSSRGQFAGDTNAESAPAVYLYDFDTGSLTWISHAAPEVAARNEGKPALVLPLPGSPDGAEVDFGDWNRALSDNGEYVVFVTGEQLQGDDVNNGLDVYEWHNGVVSMISDGRDPLGGRSSPGLISGAGVSASGSDIFFFTHTPLVGQDRDVLVDLYDARVDGGFEAPAPAQSACAGDECQGAGLPTPEFAPSLSPGFAANGNLTPTAGPPPTETGGSTKPKTKTPTRAQLLAKALRACRRKHNKGQRKRCESAAHRRHGHIVKTKTPNRKGH